MFFSKYEVFLSTWLLTEEVLQALRKGDSMRRVGPGSWSDKTQLIIFVLHEAMLQTEQKGLEQCETISVARDARRSRLMVRYGSCSTTFKIQVGLLGVERGGGDRAGQIVQSTRSILEKFCTRWSCPPRWYKGPPPEFDNDLYEAVSRQFISLIFFYLLFYCPLNVFSFVTQLAISKVRNKIEIVMTDSAPNEILAGGGGPTNESRHILISN